jgi:hypothetical protein
MLHALPVPADVGTFTLSDRTEVRVRDPDPIINRTALDLETLADARAVLASSHSMYTLAYMPRLTFLDINTTAVTPAFLNSVLAVGEWRTGHAVISVRELGSYGTTAFASLGSLSPPGSPVATGPGGQPAPIPNAQLNPTVQTFVVAASNTSVSSTLKLRPWTVTGTVGYQLSGGADSTSQQSVPFQQGPFAQGQADLKTGRSDHLVTVVSGLESSFSSPALLPPAPPLPPPMPGTASLPTAGTGVDTDVLLVQAQEQWRHSWSRTTDTMLAAGLYEARTRDAPLAPYVYSTNGTLEGSVEQRFGHGTSRGSIALDLRLVPVVNQLTGLVDQRVQGTALGSWSRRKLSLRATATAAESLDQTSPAAAKLVTAEVDASYAQSEVLSFDLGARVLAQDQNSAPTTTTGQQAGPVTQTPFNQGVVFFAVTVRAVKAHF